MRVRSAQKFPSSFSPPRANARMTAAAAAMPVAADRNMCTVSPNIWLP